MCMTVPCSARLLRVVIVRLNSLLSATPARIRMQICLFAGNHASSSVGRNPQHASCGSS